MHASFLLRLKAFLLDYLLILVYLAILFIIALFLMPSIRLLFQNSLIQAQMFGFLLITLPVSLYFIITDSRIGKQSFGKNRAKIRVLNQKGEPASVLQMTIRTIIKFLPWELSHFLAYRLVDLGDASVPFPYTLLGVLIYTLMFSYILTALFTKKKQSLYDIISKTQVVKL